MHVLACKALWINRKVTNTAAARARRYYARMKDRGLKKVSVYVPANQVASLRAFAKRLCEIEKTAKP